MALAARKLGAAFKTPFGPYKAVAIALGGPAVIYAFNLIIETGNTQPPNGCFDF